LLALRLTVVVLRLRIDVHVNAAQVVELNDLINASGTLVRSFSMELDASQPNQCWHALVASGHLVMLGEGFSAGGPSESGALPSPAPLVATGAWLKGALGLLGCGNGVSLELGKIMCGCSGHCTHHVYGGHLTRSAGHPAGNFAKVMGGVRDDSVMLIGAASLHTLAHVMNNGQCKVPTLSICVQGCVGQRVVATPVVPGGKYSVVAAGKLSGWRRVLGMETASELVLMKAILGKMRLAHTAGVAHGTYSLESAQGRHGTITTILSHDGKPTHLVTEACQKRLDACRSRLQNHVAAAGPTAATELCAQAEMEENLRRERIRANFARWRERMSSVAAAPRRSGGKRVWSSDEPEPIACPSQAHEAMGCRPQLCVAIGCPCAASRAPPRMMSGLLPGSSNARAATMDATVCGNTSESQLAGCQTELEAAGIGDVGDTWPPEGSLDDLVVLLADLCATFPGQEFLCLSIGLLNNESCAQGDWCDCKEYEAGPCASDYA
jgi:hypothetical protein